VVVRVIRPIDQIVDALTRPTRGEAVQFPAEDGRTDEIGKLIAVLRAFQDKAEEVRDSAVNLDLTVKSLEQEVGVRREAEAKTQAQLERLALLHQISRAIGERQDLNSIFQVAVDNVEDSAPADFVCLCMFDPADRALTVARVGAKSAHLAHVLGMQPQTRIELDQNGLSKCMNG